MLLPNVDELMRNAWQLASSIMFENRRHDEARAKCIKVGGVVLKEVYPD